MQTILTPSCWIIINILPNRIQRPFISNNMFIIVTLPQPFGEWFPAIVFNASNIGIGRHRFKPLYDTAQRRAVSGIRAHTWVRPYSKVMRPKKGFDLCE